MNAIISNINCSVFKAAVSKSLTEDMNRTEKWWRATDNRPRKKNKQKASENNKLEKLS